MDTPYQRGFADGWSKPHPYSGVCDKYQFTELFRSRGERCASIARVRNEIGRGASPPNSNLPNPAGEGEIDITVFPRGGAPWG